MEPGELVEVGGEPVALGKPVELGKPMDQREPVKRWSFRPGGYLLVVMI